MTHFGDRLIEANRQTGTPLCMGIDPHTDMIPRLFGDARAPLESDQAISTINDFVLACLEIACGEVAAIKPQVAFFEQQGPKGLQILKELSRAAIDLGVLVIMDNKRGDIGSTCSAYAAGWIGHNAPFPSDAITINPWLGLDTLEPFLAAADATSSGLFILNRTTNPGSGDFQKKEVEGRPLFKHLAEMLSPMVKQRIGTTSVSSLGIVAGATWSGELNELRQSLPSAPFLIPGFGAQGATAENATLGLVRGKRGWERGLINSTRGLIFPKTATRSKSISDWKKSIKETISLNKSLLNSKF